MKSVFNRERTMRIAIQSLCLVLAGLVSPLSSAFDSGSSGADGALTPSVDTEIQLPADGILEYTSIDIPAGITVTFSKNALNTPVTLLVSGDATIHGTIDVSGSDAPPSAGAGDGNLGDDGLPGEGGPGGFDGGRGGMADDSTEAGSPRIAQAGIGPGGGLPTTSYLGRDDCFGSGGSFGTSGEISWSLCSGQPGAIYGNEDLLPLIGGSGGSGGGGRQSTGGSGGGGGGGALLLAVSGTLTIADGGQIVADGGDSGDVGHDDDLDAGGRVGGGGSGGAIRLVATNLGGVGALSARGGRTGTYDGSNWANSYGGKGRIRLEADSFTFNGSSNPAYSVAQPGPLVISGVPTIRIASVAGMAAPAEPTGHGDIVLPSDAPNPVSVGLETTNVPVGNTVSVTVTPPSGHPVSVVSTALQGSEANATATASVDIPDGPSVLLATLSFSTTETQSMALSRFTGGEPVARVELASSMSGTARTRLITDSGRSVIVPDPMH
jgi:hypothetical protein